VLADQRGERWRVRVRRLQRLPEALAEATDSTPEEIEAGADSFEIGPPWDADIVDSE